MNHIIERLKTLQGHTGFYYKNMVTGETLAYQENDTFTPASIIKLPMLMQIFRMAAKGEADLTERIKIRHEDKVPSCGALNRFTDEPVVDIRTLCNLMTIISDNTATNVLISHYGTERLNKGFEEMGLEKTRVNRRLFDMESARKGISNYITPKEIGQLLEQLYNRTFVNEAVSQDILNILLEQQFDHKIPGMLPPGTKVAHKTGEDDDISNDVGIVYAKAPFVVCFVSNKTINHPFNMFIRETTLELFNQCNQ